jgi:hypothetical protein
MCNIEMSISTEFTAAQIRRARPSITQALAEELARELHGIVADVQTSFAKRLDTDRGIAFEATDVIQAVLRTVVGFWPDDEDAAADEAIWLMGMLTEAGGDELYLRYMHLCDFINLTDLAGLCDLE